MSDTNTTGSNEPVTASASGATNKRTKSVIIGVVAVLALLAAAFAAVSVIGGEDEASAEVTLRSLGEAGADAFTPSVAPAPSTNLSDFADKGAPEGVEPPETIPVATSTSYRSVDGTVPGVFGGTLDERTCDPAQLVEFLTAEQSKAQAWASALGIDAADIASYVERLTAANLGADTRVLEHGFSNGELNAREALLQRGTAVFVDARGVPRVNCYSGRPLLDPTVVDDESYQGERWQSFDKAQVLVISPASEAVEQFALFDVERGVTFTRPTGSSGESDAAPGDAVTPDEPATRDLLDAGPIDLDTLVRGEITSSKPELIYEFDAPNGATIGLDVINVRASTGRVAITLLSAGEQLTFFRVNAGGSEEFFLTLDHDGGGPFEIRVSEGPAVFEFTVTAEVQNDAGQGADAGDDFATALEVSSGQAVDGLIGGLDKADGYLLAIEGAPKLILTLEVSRSSAARAAFELKLAGDQLQFIRVNPGADATFTLLFGPDDDGWLELFVTEGAAEYRFTAELIPQADGGQAGDAGNELAEARELDTDTLTAIKGEVGDRDSGDYYLFEAGAAQLTLEATVDARSQGRIAFSLFGPDGNGIEFFRVQPGASDSVSFDTVTGQSYRLLVNEGPGQYTVSIS